MDRRAFLGTLALLGAPLAVEAQPAGKMHRVGILGESASDPAEERVWQAFRGGLRELGWIEGQNIAIESRWAEGNSTRLPELAAALVGLKVDVIVTRGSTYVEGARKATSTIPIVFVMHADPERTGHVASLARPGGHITGLALLQTEIYPKQLEILVAAVPAAKRGSAKPAELPVEQPTKFQLVINLKPARALGLSITPSLLHRADQVIE